MTDPNQSPGNGAASAVAAKTLNVLVIGTDLAFAKQVQTALQSIAGDNPDTNYRVFPGTTKEKVMECLEKAALHSVIVDEEFLTDTTADQLLKQFKDMAAKFPANEKVPFVFAVNDVSAKKAKDFVRMGWKDVLVKPLDRTLFLQKMHLYNTADHPLLKEPILFTMDLAKDVEVAFQFKTQNISEYGMKVASNQPLVPGAVVAVLAEFLETSLYAVVIDCAKGADGGFSANLMFIGVTPAETQSIRKLIRHEYAEEKQAA